MTDHWRIPSVSLIDFLDERTRIIQAGQNVRLIDWMMIPFILTIGGAIDIAQLLLTKGFGEGRWSWTLTASLAATLACLFNRPKMILSTGGPASAHLSAIVAGKLCGLPVIIELQDPLSGQGIGRNAQARGWLFRVEKFLIRQATKVVYVTDGAAKFAQEQFNANHISSVYPGAKDFKIQYCPMSKTSEKFRLVHLGSLYATRDFTSVIAAIEMLIMDNKVKPESIELINLGHVSPNIQQEILKKNYVKIYPPISRLKALQYAVTCNATLLIQNNDDRSQVTIPYKTYDYLNLQTPLIALLNSSELTNLIKSHGGNAFNLNDVKGLSMILLEMMNNPAPSKLDKSLSIDPVIQVKKLLAI
jgi:hypothetical protein